MPPSDSSRREQAGWYVYDWANSAFYTVVVTLLFGPYVTTVLARGAADAQGFVYPLGIQVDARSYWSYLVGLSVAIQVLVLPAAGALADSTGRKKALLALFAYSGAGATMAMYFLEGSAYLWGGLLFLIANVAFGASIVVYNSFLPEIATAEERDSVSSKGWGIGYLGGGVLLALDLALLGFADRLGLTQGQAVRISFASAGAWWALFTIVPLMLLRSRSPVHRGSLAAAIPASFRQLGHTLRDLRRYPQTLAFLLAYLLYNDAVQAVIVLSGQFGHDQLHIPIEMLTLLILMVQFLAFVGALAFNLVAGRLGAKRTVMLSLVIWTAIIVAIYGWVRTTAAFFVAGAAVALVLGGTQALSRSLFSLMIPKNREAEYFSLYEVSDRGTSWLAPVIFGLALQFTGSYRIAILSLVGFFVLGLAVLARVNVERAARDASGSE
jgi:UMF1 family MFS transporter